MDTVSTNVLMVGVGDRGSALEELPVRLLMMDTGAEAIRCLREEKIDTVISQWHLVDLPPGRLLENIIKAKPSMPTVAFIRPGDPDQEIAARSMGVTAVLSEDVNDDYFRDVVCQLLGIATVKAMHMANDCNDEFEDPCYQGNNDWN